MERDINDYTKKYLADDYEKVNVKYRRNKVLEILNTHKPKRILEVGCGEQSLFDFYDGWETFTIVEPSAEFCSLVKKSNKYSEKITVLNGFFGTPEITQKLSGGGYDCIVISFPSRIDGTKKVMMSNQLILNASLSRKNALAYSTNRTISYGRIASEYGEDYFIEGSKSKAAQMYDGKGSFYTIIESLRCNTSNGMVHGEVIDSVDSYSERVFLEELLKYCKETGVEVISKAKAYDVCFNHELQGGNLIYNPTFRNTAKEFLKDADFVPANPDGYVGDCYVSSVDGSNHLCTKGKTSYWHYGVPLGNLSYSVFCKGAGEITIYAIKNNTPCDYQDSDLMRLGSIKIDSEIPEDYSIDFEIPDNPETEYEQICGGFGEKIMGIEIVYSGGLTIEKIDLRKK